MSSTSGEMKDQFNSVSRTWGIITETGNRQCWKCNITICLWAINSWLNMSVSSAVQPKCLRLPTERYQTLVLTRKGSGWNKGNSLQGLFGLFVSIWRHSSQSCLIMVRVNYITSIPTTVRSHRQSTMFDLEKSKGPSCGCWLRTLLWLIPQLATLQS